MNWGWEDKRTNFDRYVDVLFTEYLMEKRAYNEKADDRKTWENANEEFIKREYSKRYL
jgi:hypothetical protein